MNNGKSNRASNPGLKLRQMLRQEITLKQAGIIGSAIGGVALMLLVMFNVMNREESKAVDVSEAPAASMIQNTLKNIDISPNPFNESFTVKFESLSKEEITVQLASISGKIIYRENITVEPGMNLYCYKPVKKLTSGPYIFRIINNNSILLTAKLICNNS